MIDDYITRILYLHTFVVAVNRVMSVSIRIILLFSNIFKFSSCTRNRVYMVQKILFMYSDFVIESRIGFSLHLNIYIHSWIFLRIVTTFTNSRTYMINYNLLGYWSCHSNAKVIFSNIIYHQITIEWCIFSEQILRS